MKKGKVLGKGQLTVAVLLLSLCAAIWLNAKYVPSNTKYLGEASYVNTTDDNNAVETSAEVSTKDYFENAKLERENARKEASETVEELLDTKNLSENDKKSALEKVEIIAKNIQTEADIESLLKAKGFEKCLAVINDKGINIIVKSDGLSTAQTLQIQDIVTNQTDVNLSNIKIIPIAE